MPWKTAIARKVGWRKKIRSGTVSEIKAFPENKMTTFDQPAIYISWYQTGSSKKQITSNILKVKHLHRIFKCAKKKKRIKKEKKKETFLPVNPVSVHVKTECQKV